jgi:hypothetical protein
MRSAFRLRGERRYGGQVALRCYGATREETAATERMRVSV